MCGLETSLGRNHHFWCPPPSIKSLYFFGQRPIAQFRVGVLSKTPFYRRPPTFHQRPHIFIRNLKLFMGGGGGRIFSLGTRYKHLYRYISRINEREEYFNNCSICNSKVQHLFIQFQRMFQIFDNLNYKNSSGSSNNT